MHLIWHLWNNQDTCLIIHRCQVISGAFSTKSYTETLSDHSATTQPETLSDHSGHHTAYE